MSFPEEHRLAAIMFTDIVGYSSLMRHDEQAAMDMLRKNRQHHKRHIQDNGGIYLKEIGDGTLASFPTATKAVKCASALIDHLATLDIRLRVGIHIGEVIFEGSDVFGDGVNIASRLEAMAAPGTILVSEALYQTVKSKPGVHADFLDEVTLKGFSEPTKVYKLWLESTTPNVSPPTGHQNGKSVAVLPFANMSPDPDQVYFSDGLSEELINALSRLTQLHVCARTSAFQFRGQSIDIREIGRQLNVGFIVTGSVRRSGDRLRIIAQLVDAQNGYHLWSERFDREMDDIFKIQDEISLAIVNNLKLQLLSDDRTRLLSRYTSNHDAYHAYLRANYYLNKRTLADFERAIMYYRSVLRVDPEYALGYSGLAFAYTLLARYGGMRPHEAFAQVKKCAERALSIDPDLHEGHLGLALYEGLYAWRWSRAEAAFLKALELNANHAATYHQYGWFLASTARVEEGLAKLERAKGIDPLSAIINTNIGTLHYFHRAYPRAEAKLLEVLTRDPDFVVAHQWLGRCYEVTSRFDQAIEHHARALALLGDDPECIASLGHAQALAGDDQRARSSIEQLVELASEQFVSNYWLALVYQGLGDLSTCFDNLQAGLEERSDWMKFLHIDPLWEPLEKEPAFADILKRVRQSDDSLT